MFTREYIQLMTAYCGEMDSECPWTRHMTFEQILDEIYTYAQEIDGCLEMTVFIANELNNEDTEVDYLINFIWKRECGFFAYVSIRDNEFELDISGIDMKTYGSNEMPDYQVVIDKGLQFLNELCK